MPVKGKINLTISHVVHDMSVGDKKYIYSNDVIITKECIFLHLATEVFGEEFVLLERDADEEVSFILIERIGQGLDEKDFLLDFSGTEDFILSQDSHIVHNECIRNKASYITFSEFERRVLSDGFPESLEDLKAELDKALEDEDFIAAAKFRDEIESRKNLN